MNITFKIICLVAILGVECLVLKQKLTVPFNWQRIDQGMNLELAIAKLKSGPGAENIPVHPKVISAKSDENRTQMETEISLSKQNNAGWDLPNSVTDATGADTVSSC